MLLRKNKMMRKQNTRELLIEKYIKPSSIEIRILEGVVIDATERWFNKYGELHSINDQPSYIKYYKNGNIRHKTWHKNNKGHREKLRPTYIYYEYNGKVCFMQWYKNGKYIKQKSH